MSDADEARTIRYDDVDDVIGLAAEKMNAARDALTVDDLKKVGRELDIPDAFIEQALVTLEARRREAAAARDRKRKISVRVGIGVGAVIVVFLTIVFAGVPGLRAQHETTMQRRAQVLNVLVRQAHIEARLRDEPATRERSAELEGAENRVALERRRYDEAAARYDADASGPIGGLRARLAGLPSRLPLSNEIRSW